MELIKVNNLPVISESKVSETLELLPSEALPEIQNESTPFIEANTILCSLSEMKMNHLIPSFAKDGEPLISHTDFVELVLEQVRELFDGEQVLDPAIRLSHEIQGRIPSARNKPAKELLQHERTLYYERMMFAVEIPSIKGNIGGNQLSLTVGGVKSFSEDNLFGRSGTEQHFKLFIGFQNQVCTNLCISTDGLLGNIAIKNVEQLKIYTKLLFEQFNYNLLLTSLEGLVHQQLSERQFATLIGKCRMYNHFSKTVQGNIPLMQFGEAQIGNVVSNYYKNADFGCSRNGSIDLWRLYNLFTGANKSSYIDSFAPRAVNAFSFVYGLKTAIEKNEDHWFLN